MSRNIDRIWVEYTATQRAEFNNNVFQATDLTDINKGTVLLVPESDAVIELSLIGSKN